MAIYHFSAKIISRKDGRTSTACSAYRAAEKVTDTRTGEIHDFTRKRGVIHTQIVMPPGCSWQPKREELWNAVEHKNKRKDAQVAREFVAALPDELDAAQQLRLACLFAMHLAERYNIAVDFAMHKPSEKGDQRNTHGHFLSTTNMVIDSKLGNKQRELDPIAHNQNAERRNGSNAIDELREVWQNLANQALELADVDARIDSRSLADQDIDRAPQVHMGPIATAIERNGRSSKRGQYAKNKAAELEAELDYQDRLVAAAEEALPELFAKHAELYDLMEAGEIDAYEYHKLSDIEMPPVAPPNPVFTPEFNDSYVPKKQSEALHDAPKIHNSGGFEPR